MKALNIDKTFLELSDENLVNLFQVDEEKVFNEIKNRYDYLISIKVSNMYVLGLERDDLVQEATLALLDAVKTYDKSKKATFKTYASVCITRRLISAYRFSTRKKNEFFNNSLSIDDIGDFKAVSDENNPEDIVISKEDSEKLNQIIKSKLSQLELAVLFLHINGKSYSQISDELFVTQKSVDNAMQRIRKKLKNNND